MSRPSLETLSTIGKDGSRSFLHPFDVKGRFQNLRRIVYGALIGIYVLLPWIPVNGRPAVFLDIPNRRFHLFGQTFVSQDFWLVFFLITGLAFLLFYLTALFGRVWCGYACPQTVFLEGAYRRVERWVEGSANRRKRLDAAPWNREKLLRRGGKHAIFLLLSFAIAHVFIAYFVSIPELYRMMGASPLQHGTAFFWAFAITGVLYFNFAWFREQLCIVLCPYGRLQSALIDDDSIVIGYDEKRGEPRGPLKAEGAGDCVDCFRCVNVCPTGIDIRHGLQMECIGCTACIDACDEVMDKVGRPRGLIRYDSLNGLAGGKTRIVRARTVLYTVLIFIGAGLFYLALSQVSSYEAGATRMSGAPYYRSEDRVRNHFQVRVINKTNESRVFTLRAEAEADGFEWQTPEPELRVEAFEERVIPVFTYVPRASFSGSFPVTVCVESVSDAWKDRLTVTFVGPEVY